MSSFKALDVPLRGVVDRLQLNARFNMYLRTNAIGRLCTVVGTNAHRESHLLLVLPSHLLSPTLGSRHWQNS
jgi:hypothetical protein